jgi:hypothetical protein
LYRSWDEPEDITAPYLPEELHYPELHGHGHH